MAKEKEIKEVKVEMPTPPKPPEQEKQKEMTTDERLRILEHNISAVITDINERLGALERFAIKNSK